MRRLKVQGEERWVTTDAATGPEACGCEVGSRLDESGACVVCDIEGIDCPGKGEVYVQPGYFSAEQLSVFRCSTAENCRGGVPGHTCAEGREGLACASCIDGYVPGDRGVCVPCRGGDRVPFVFAVFGVVGVCVLLYAVFERGGFSEPSHGVLLAGISGGLLVSLLQQMSILGVLSIEYAEPLKSFLSVMRIFAFDVEGVLRIGCIGSFGAFARFCIKVCMILAALVVVRHRGRFKERKPVLLAIVGTLAMMFYISITLTTLRPLQCIENPNGMWTNILYEDVICWSWGGSGGGAHMSMIIVSAFAVTLPISMLVKVALLARRYPSAVRRGDSEFLRSYGFLFFRFRPHAHWYILVVMCRSLFVGIVPLVPGAIMQVFLFLVALQVTLLTAIHFKPWRVPALNWMDVGFGCIMVLCLMLASFSVRQEDSQDISWIVIVVMMVAALSLPVVLTHAVLKRFGAVSKLFQFFLCHSKVDAGAFARWLKIELKANNGVKHEVFLDADNLESLDSLLLCVAVDVETFVLLGSNTAFFRPWCIAEMTTAHAHKVECVLIALPGIRAPDEFMLEHLETMVPDIELLLDTGLRVETMREALGEFAGKPRILVPENIDSVGAESLADMLARRVRRGVVEMVEAKSDVAPDTIVVSDTDSFEAKAAAAVIQRLLISQATNNVGEVVQVLQAGMEIAESVEKAVIACSSGCFSQIAFVGRLLEVSDRGIYVLPVIVDADFRIPARDALEDIDTSALPHGPNGPRSLREVSLAVFTLFREIAVFFVPKSATEAVLVATAARIDHRLTKWRTRQTGQQSYAISDISSKADSRQDLQEEEVAAQPTEVAIVLPQVMSVWRESNADASALEFLSAYSLRTEE